MANLLYLFRYFQVVPPVPPLMRHALGVVTAVGLIAIVGGGDTTGAPLMPVIVVQAFSASSGFAVPARRGYFDMLIARGETSGRIAAIQWLTAVVPGLCSWTTLAAVERLAHGPGHAGSASGTATAFLMASAIPWVVTVPLPRFSGAIGWLLLVCLSAGGGVVWPDPVREVVFPLALVGHSMADRQPVLVADLSLCLAGGVAALWWVNRTDIPLEAGQ